MKIAIVSASPKRSDTSLSGCLAGIAGERFTGNGLETVRIDVGKCIRQGACASAYETMRSSDALLFIFPLYFFCVPGLLMRFLQDYSKAAATVGGKPGKIYAVVNCGFDDPGINGEALRVIRSFARHTGNDYRFGMAIGSGGMLLGAQKAPVVRKAMKTFADALDRIVEDLAGAGAPQEAVISVRVKVPRFLYMFMGNLGWRQMAKKNGLRKKDLYRAPYAR